MVGMAPIVAFGVGAAVFLLICSLSFGWSWTLLTYFVVALGIFPQVSGVEIGGMELGLNALSLIALGAIAMVALNKRTFTPVFIPILVYLLLGLNTFWQGNAEQFAGAFTILLAVCACGGARFLSDHFDRRLLAYTLLGIVMLELVVCVLQTLGYDLFPTYGAAELEASRANGTLGHPGGLGKVLTVLMVLALPLSRAADERTRKVALVAIVMSLIPIGLTESRANFVAVIATLIVWIVLLPREKNSRKLGFFSVIFVVGLFFSETIISRFVADPSGGGRAHFLEVALQQIPKTPWFGVGPDSYLSVLGQTDALTAQGWRVHNIFVLEVVELGIIGGVLFFLPLLIGAVKSLKRYRAPGVEADFARAYLAVIPGFIVMGVTGWGLMNSWMLFCWMFMFAFALAQSSGVRKTPTEPGLQAPAQKVAQLAR
jgi:hypothetical protein